MLLFSSLVFLLPRATDRTCSVFAFNELNDDDDDDDDVKWQSLEFISI